MTTRSEWEWIIGLALVEHDLALVDELKDDDVLRMNFSDRPALKRSRPSWYRRNNMETTQEGCRGLPTCVTEWAAFRNDPRRLAGQLERMGVESV